MSGPDPVFVDRGSTLGPMMEQNDRGRNTTPSDPRIEVVLRRSDRARTAPTHLTDYVCYGSCLIDPSRPTHSWQGSSGTPYPIANYVACNKFSSTHQHFLAAITKIVEPRHFHEAVQNPLWRKAMEEEIQALEENHTWTIKELPADKKAISCK